MLWFVYNPDRDCWREVQATDAEWIVTQMNGVDGWELEGWQVVCLDPETLLLFP